MAKNKEFLRGIKGLTAKDRQKWEKKALKDFNISQEQWNSLSDDKKTEGFFYAKFKEAFSGRDDYDYLKGLSYEDSVKFWNANYDLENTVTDFSVEHNPTRGNVFDESLPYSKNDGLPTTTMLDIFGNQLSANTRETIDTEDKKTKDFFGTYGYNTENLLGFAPKKLFNEKQYKNDPMYYTQVDEYSKSLKNLFDNNPTSLYRSYKQFDDVVSKVSSVYNLHKNTDRLGLSAGDIKDVMSYYYAIKDLSGENDANQFVADYMQNRLAKRQSISEKWWEGFKGMGASAAGAIVQTYGILDAIVSGDAFENEDYNPELSGWSNFWNKAIDNDITRYGKDIITYQSYKRKDIAALKAAGVQGGSLFRTVEEERGDLGDMIWNANFLPSMIQQHGFTIAASAISFGTSGLFNLASKVVGKGTKVGKVFRGIGAFAGAGLAGTGESVMNALDTKDAVIQEGSKQIEDKFNKWAAPQLDAYEKEVDKLLMQLSWERANSENPMTQEEYDKSRYTLMLAKKQELQNKYAETKQDLYNQLEKEAVQAQNTNFAFNQAITGFLNVGLKNAVMHPSVRQLFNKVDRSSVYKIAKDGKWYQKGWFYGKRMLSESLGEGIEEGATELTDAISQGWHKADFEHYLENGYNAVGWEGFTDSVGAAWQGTKKALKSKETAYSFISGALSSGISTMNINGVYNAYQTFRDENATALDKTRALSSIFLRSSIVEGYQHAKAELDEAKIELKALNDFASDPKHVRTHTGVATMANFMAERNASTDSELDYRNSQLGMTIAEINTLERVKDTNPEFYEATIRELDALENLDETTEFGKEKIAEYRNAGIADVSSQTDAEIAKTIRDNASEFKKFRERVIKTKNANARYYRDIADPDILDALTYGDIAYEENKGRVEKMSSEVEEAFKAGQDSSTQLHEDGDLTKEQISHLVKYGASSFSGSEASIKKLKENIEKDKEKISKLEEDKKKQKRKDKKATDYRIKKLNESLAEKEAKLKEMTESHNAAFPTGNEYVILSEKQIMGLSHADRAKVMSQEFYDNAHEEQKAVIDNLKDILRVGDSALAVRENDPITGQSTIKIADIAALEESQRLHKEIKREGVDAITRRGRVIKYNALKRQSEERIRSVGQIKDFEEFETTLSALLNNPQTSFMDLSNAEEILKNNANYKRYKQKQINTKVLYDKMSEAIKKDSSLTAEEAMAEMIMTSYLASSEVGISETDKIIELLTPEKIREYYSNTSKGNINPQINFSLELINDFKLKLFLGGQQVAQVETINEPIKIDDTESDKDIPSTDPVVPVDPPTETPNATFKNYSIDSNVDEIIDSIISDFSSKGLNILHNTNALNVIVACLVNPSKLNKAIMLAGFSGGFDSITAQSVQEFIGEENTSYEVELALVQALHAKITIKEDGKIYLFDKDVTDLVNTKLLKKNLQQTTKPKSKDDLGTTSDSAVIIKGHPDYAEIGAKEKEHKVEEWLKTHSGNKDKRVKVVPAVDIKGLTTEFGTPLYFVIEDKNGTITIGGQKYQVIGVVPPIQGVEEGNTIIGQLQRMAIKQGLTEFGFLKKEAENGETTDEDVRFKGFTVQSTSPQQTSKEYSNAPVRNFISTLSGGIEEFFKRIVKGHEASEYNSSKSTLSYKSPFQKDKYITHTISKDPSKVIERDYIAFISLNGKPTGYEDGGESQIEIFAETFDKYVMPNGKHFLASLLSKDESLYDPKESGHFVAKYLDVLYKNVRDIASALSAIEGEFNKLDGSIRLNQEMLDKIYANVESLNSTLRNYIYHSGVKLQLKQEASNGVLSFSIEFVDDNKISIAKIPLGTFSSKDDVTAQFTSQFEKDSILEFVKNSFTQNGKLRMYGENPMFKVQVNYQDIEKVKDAYGRTDMESVAIIKHITELIESGILTVSKDALERGNWGVTIHKAVDSLIQGRTITSPKGGGEVLTPEGVKDVATGIILDKTIKTTPVVNTTVKEKLDKLVEAKKQRDARRAAREQSTETPTTSRDYLSSDPIDTTVAAVGNLYDSAIRGLINGDIKTVKEIIEKFPNFTEKEASNIFDYVSFIIEAATNDGWTLDAREMYLNTQLPKKDGSGEFEEFHGIPDIVGYNDIGEIIIIDIKTFLHADGLIAEQKVSSWSGQTSDYANALSKLTGCIVKDVYALPLQVNYSREANVVSGQLREGLGFASVSSEVRKFGKNILEKLEYSRTEIPIEEPKSVEDVVNDDTPLTGDGLNDFMAFMSGLTETEEEKQANDCKIPK